MNYLVPLMSIKVEHSGGWKPNTYLPYCVDGSSYKTPKRKYEGLPSLPRVSKPKGLEQVEPKPDAKPFDESISKANNKDLKARNLNTPDK
jgi:hypothetical protein